MLRGTGVYSRGREGIIRGGSIYYREKIVVYVTMVGLRIMGV